MQTQVESDHLNRRLAPNFMAREFICPCCNEEGITDELVFHLQLAHNMLPINSVMIITSGYRCESYTREKKRNQTSSHLKGLAADIKCTDSTYRNHLIKSLMMVGFTRIGIGRDFIHCDLDKDKAQTVMWTYYPEKNND